MISAQHKEAPALGRVLSQYSETDFTLHIYLSPDFAKNLRQRSDQIFDPVTDPLGDRWLIHGVEVNPVDPMRKQIDHL